jgi:hypothetical protein
METIDHRYWKDNKCRYDLYIAKCSECLFENLCRFEHNQERIWKATHEAEKITERS